MYKPPVYDAEVQESLEFISRFCHGEVATSSLRPATTSATTTTTTTAPGFRTHGPAYSSALLPTSESRKVALAAEINNQLPRAPSMGDGMAASTGERDAWPQTRGSRHGDDHQHQHQHQQHFGFQTEMQQERAPSLAFRGDAAGARVASGGGGNGPLHDAWGEARGAHAPPQNSVSDTLRRRGALAQDSAWHGDTSAHSVPVIRAPSPAPPLQEPCGPGGPGGGSSRQVAPRNPSSSAIRDNSRLQHWADSHANPTRWSGSSAPQHLSEQQHHQQQLVFTPGPTPRPHATVSMDASPRHHHHQQQHHHHQPQPHRSGGGGGVVSNSGGGGRPLTSFAHSGESHTATLERFVMYLKAQYAKQDGEDALGLESLTDDDVFSLAQCFYEEIHNLVRVHRMEAQSRPAQALVPMPSAEGDVGSSRPRRQEHGRDALAVEQEEPARVRPPPHRLPHAATPPPPPPAPSAAQAGPQAGRGRPDPNGGTGPAASESRQSQQLPSDVEVEPVEDQQQQVKEPPGSSIHSTRLGAAPAAVSEERLRGEASAVHASGDGPAAAATATATATAVTAGNATRPPPKRGWEPPLSLPEAMRHMRQGAFLVKYGRTGKPQLRFLIIKNKAMVLSGSEKAEVPHLCWMPDVNSRKEGGALCLVRLLSVELGPHSGSFRRGGSGSVIGLQNQPVNPNWLFTLTFTDRAVELYAQSQDDFDVWAGGMLLVLQRNKEMAQREPRQD